MEDKNNKFIAVRKWSFYCLGFILLVLYSCAQVPEAQSGPAESKAEKLIDSSSAMKVQLVVLGDSQGAGAKSKIEPNVTEPAKIAPPRIVESCKGEPFGGYEKQARESIKKGLDATKAGKYGVGFRDLKEHKRWSGIHKNLFRKVNGACGSLSKCAKQHPKDKAARCANQAAVFDKWQAMSKRFANKAKMVEYTQPDKICSFEPNLNDAPQCFHTLGDNVDKVCSSPACKEVADCWRGIGFLDLAIKQASTACGFVFKKLSDCRGYTEATSRRVKKFEQCKDMQGSLKIVKFPAL
jgi:hypothetical protein